VSLADFLLNTTPRVLPGSYDRFAEAVLGNIHNQLAREAAERFPNSAILDHGAGTANLLRKLAGLAPNTTLVAVDKSDHMLLTGEERAAAEGVRESIDFCLVDDLPLPWPERRFDLIVSCFVAGEEHARIDHLLELYHRHLAPGGECWLVDGCADSLIPDATIAALLRELQAAPRWLPRPLLTAAVRRERARWFSLQQLVALAHSSPFGFVHNQRSLSIEAGSARLEDLCVQITLRRADLELASSS
jgi:ubiquinone/menaquinone biosynthesis C-methylase UbiE